jgi:F0F1-type ATP synthase membrane subunit b/b'
MFEVNGTSLVVFGSFAVYMAVMNKLFFAPLFQVTQARQVLIDTALEKAQAASEKHAELTASCEQKLKDARERAHKTIQTVVDETRLKAAGIKTQARNEANDQVQKQTEALDQAASQCYESLKGQQDQFVSMLADKIKASSSRTASLVS